MEAIKPAVRGLDRVLLVPMNYSQGGFILDTQHPGGFGHGGYGGSFGYGNAKLQLACAYTPNYLALGDVSAQREAFLAVVHRCITIEQLTNSKSQANHGTGHGADAATLRSRL